MVVLHTQNHHKMQWSSSIFKADVDILNKETTKQILKTIWRQVEEQSIPYSRAVQNGTVESATKDLAVMTSAAVWGRIPKLG